jgi:succinoglycan biosynthesis transport protein ExoP
MAKNENPEPVTSGRGAANSPPAAQTQNRLRRHDDRPDLWRIAHRALRGRYRIALLLTVVGAIAGAGIGALVGHRLYRATGLVRIAAARPQVMKSTDQNQSMPMFDGFIQAQQVVMTSREIVHAAMLDPNWSPVATGRRPISEEEFAASLNVETRHGSDHLRVTYVDPDPRVSAAAVQSIIFAYQRAYDAEEKRAEQQRIDELQNRRAAVSSELKSVDEQIGVAGTASDGAGATAAIEPLYEATTARLKRLRSALVDVQCGIAGFPETSEKPGPTTSPEEAVASTLMSDYVAEEARNEMELARLTQGGYGDSHPMVVRLRAAVREDEKQIANYAQSVEQLHRARTPVTSTDKLKEQEATILRLCAAAESEINRLAAERSRLTMLGAHAAELRQGLNEVTNRLDVLGTEASLGSRLTIVSGGDKPMTALLDSRPKTAAIGAAVGAVTPLGALILLASLRRRYRNPIEVAEDLATRVPFVAVLPEANPSATSAELVARAVHQLRVRLQPPAASSSRIYLITSPTAGDGKTGITLSLGLSFAAAGYRTLIIDGDLLSHRLTRGLGADHVDGFRDAVHGGEPTIRYVRGGLSFMAAGYCRPQDQYMLAASHIGRVLDRVRKQFDVVLIDSDPLLTGVTSAITAPHVDGVVFTVTRDQSHATVREAMRLLEQENAPIAGCVFNRTADANAPTHGNKSSKQKSINPAIDDEAPPIAAPSIDGTKPDETRGIPSEAFNLLDRLRAFGPLVASVMSSLAWAEEEEIALIAPPASQPRIHIFPSAPSTGDPYSLPRVA